MLRVQDRRYTARCLRFGLQNGLLYGFLHGLLFCLLVCLLCANLFFYHHRPVY
jgi:hypothetical protein